MNSITEALNETCSPEISRVAESGEEPVFNSPKGGGGAGGNVKEDNDVKDSDCLNANNLELANDLKEPLLMEGRHQSIRPFPDVVYDQSKFGPQPEKTLSSSNYHPPVNSVNSNAKGYSDNSTLPQLLPDLQTQTPNRHLNENDNTARNRRHSTQSAKTQLASENGVSENNGEKYASYPPPNLITQGDIGKTCGAAGAAAPSECNSLARLTGEEGEEQLYIPMGGIVETMDGNMMLTGARWNMDHERFSLVK